MSLNMSASKTKTTNTANSTSNSTSRSTTTPLVPQWGSDLTQRVAGRVGSFLDVDPYESVAPVHALQSQAVSRAGALGGLTAPPQIGAVSSGRGESLLDNLQAYMSPYTNDVVDTALADYDFGAGQTRAEQDLALARDGAFGGSGAAITRSMTEDALTRGRATTSANLRDQAFIRGAALSSEDANRRQQSAGLNAQLAQDRQSRNADLLFGYDANERSNIASLAGLGETMRGIDQQRREAPMANAQQLVAMLQGLPISLFTGQQADSSATENESSEGTSKTKGFSVGASYSFPGAK